MRKELARISRERSVDIDVAISILAQEKGFKDWGKESMDFKAFLASHPKYYIPDSCLLLLLS